MKTLIIIVAVLVVLFVIKKIVAGPAVSPAEVQQKLDSGQAVIIDIREPSECASGVLAKALLLPLSDLQGERRLWKKALEDNKDKELILYCRSGMRAGVAAGILRKEGYKVSNAGGYSGLQAAGYPVRKP